MRVPLLVLGFGAAFASSVYAQELPKAGGSCPTLDEAAKNVISQLPKGSVLLILNGEPAARFQAFFDRVAKSENEKFIDGKIEQVIIAENLIEGTVIAGLGIEGEVCSWMPKTAVGNWLVIRNYLFPDKGVTQDEVKWWPPGVPQPKIVPDEEIKQQPAPMDSEPKGDPTNYIDGLWSGLTPL